MRPNTAVAMPEATVEMMISLPLWRTFPQTANRSVPKKPPMPMAVSSSPSPVGPTWTTLSA